MSRLRAHHLLRSQASSKVCHAAGQSQIRTRRCRRLPPPPWPSSHLPLTLVFRLPLFHPASITTGKARAAAVGAIISRFVHEKCIVDHPPGTFIDLEPRDGRLG